MLAVGRGAGALAHRALAGSGAGWRRCATTRRRPSAWACPRCSLKLFATTVSGFLLGVAGAPFPYYVTFVEPNSAFNLDYAVNALGHAHDRRHHELDRAR